MQQGDSASGHQLLAPGQVSQKQVEERPCTGSGVLGAGCWEWDSLILEKHFPLVDEHKQPRGRSRVLSPGLWQHPLELWGPRSSTPVAPWHAIVPG